MSGHNMEEERNIRKATEAWDNDGITFQEGSNTYKLMRALLSIADDEDERLHKIRDAHHIDHAEGKELEQIGELVQIRRKSNEDDDKYRARIKVQFRVGNIGTTFDEFAEFAAVLLETSVDNIEYNFNFEGQPATVTVATDPAIYDNVQMSNTEIAEFLSRAVPAGHNVEALERGTLRLKSDGETDDPSKGLTSDSMDDGGTLAADIT